MGLACARLCTTGDSEASVKQTTESDIGVSGPLIQKEARVIMVGLDGAGKTTIRYRLTLGQIETPIPTIGEGKRTVSMISFRPDRLHAGARGIQELVHDPLGGRGPGGQGVVFDCTEPRPFLPSLAVL